MNENNSKKLSVDPYKGTRDFYPKDQFIQNYIFGVWKKVVEQYGYLEYNASILEETELYKAKSGDEIINEQTYSFIDRGGREVTMRPEMTPTVARLVAQKRRELIFPLRWYSIPNLFRYERPQRGRLREHWQLNVDMFGVESVDADVEIIAIASDIMKAFGANPDNFEIRINSRRVVNFLLKKYLGLSDETSLAVSKLIDRKDKMTTAEFTAANHQILGEKAQLLLEVLYIKSLDELGEKFADKEGVLEIQLAISKLKALGISNVIYDPTLMRGFDYYTGIVFEVFDVSPLNNRSVFGGGRYDDLVSLFEVEKVSGVGFGVGDVTIRDFLETYQLLPEYKPATQLYICPFDENFVEFSNILAQELRAQGLFVSIDVTNRKLQKKVMSADREKIPFVIVVGDEEIKTNTYVVKELSRGIEEKISRDSLAQFVLSK